MTKDEVRKAAVEVLDKYNELSIEEAIDQVSDECGCDKDRARVNLLVVSKQDRSNGKTMLSLSDGISADDYLTDDVADDNSTNQSEEDEGLPAAAKKEKRDPPSVWSSESFTLDKGLSTEQSPPPTSDTWYSLYVREEEGHPLVPETSSYINQEVEISGKKTGVTELEYFSHLVEDPDFGVCIVGEPGSGKGHMVKYAAAQVNAPLVRVNMGTRITKEKLVGGWVPKQNGNNDLNKALEEAKDLADDEDEITVGKALDMMGLKDKFRWKDGLFTLAYRHGWWILVDEINAAEAETLMPFFGALEDRDSRSLELTENSETIKPHPGFKFIATKNPEHHQGTHQTNDALDDRMRFMEKEYLPQKKEANLLVNKEGVSKGTAEDLVRFANDLRNAYPQEISQTLTPRGLFRICRDLSLFGPQDAARQELLPRIEYEDEKDAIERKIEASLDEEL